MMQGRRAELRRAAPFYDILSKIDFVCKQALRPFYDILNKTDHACE